MTDWESVWQRRDSGDLQGAMEALYQMMRAASLDSLLIHCRVPEDAEDVLHDAFLRVLQGIPSILDRSKLRNYTLSTVRFALIDRYRLHDNSLRAELPDDLADTSPDPEERVCRNERLRFIHRLPRPEREIVVRSLDGQSRANICRVMNISDAVYRNRKHRGIRRLRIQLAA